MDKAIEYRGIAAKLKREAASAGLPQVRNLKLGAASRWETLAQEIETIAAPSAHQSRANWIF
jgi:hypothetical protein